MVFPNQNQSNNYHHGGSSATTPQQQQRPSLQSVAQSIRNNIDLAASISSSIQSSLPSSSSNTTRTTSSSNHNNLPNNMHQAHAVLSECGAHIHTAWQKVSNKEDYITETVSKGYFLMDDEGQPIQTIMQDVVKDESRSPLDCTIRNAKQIVKDVRDDTLHWVQTGQIRQQQQPQASSSLSLDDGTSTSNSSRNNAAAGGYVVPTLGGS